MGDSKRRQLEVAAAMATANLHLGATGEHSRGKLDASDEGDLRMAIGVQDKTVILTFGKPVAWIGLDKTTALAFADNIRKQAESI